MPLRIAKIYLVRKIASYICMYEYVLINLNLYPGKCRTGLLYVHEQFYL